ncbi:glycoside hydrolase [Roseibium sp.]|uniref:glycoside hydrolase n=1 Tax=Roseibium sp. TaxID=1936156 RepID=UPI003B52A572
MGKLLRWGQQVLASATFGLLIASPVYAEQAVWLPVLEADMIVPSGSPLDFSALLPNTPINEADRLVISPGGKIAPANRGTSADGSFQGERLFCASLAWSPASGGFPDHKTADVYARQLAMHGYNAARLHFVDASLMIGRQRDFDFDPAVMDRIQYLLAALKKEGIYWVIDGMTSWRGAYGGYDDRWDPNGNLKLSLYFDTEALSHWKRLIREVLARENPYTGLKPVDDPALALVVLNNENGIEFESVVQERFLGGHYDKVLQEPFNQWLEERYGQDYHLQNAWGGLGLFESLSANTISLPRDRYADSKKMRDFQAFLIDAERKSYLQMSGYLRSLGYDGLISTYNNWPTIQTAQSRVNLDVVTMNTYHDWVSGYHPGSNLKQTSSIEDLATYYRMMASSRFLDKPFLATEWDHLFWNRYRYEAGLVMGSYASLQDWSGICRHGHGPIVLRYGEDVPHKRAMLPYAIALDPIARAGEKLAALLFRRRDVSPSDFSVALRIEGEDDLTEDMQAHVPEFLTLVSLFSQFGLTEKPETSRADVVMGPLRDLSNAGQFWRDVKASGVMPVGNLTNPDKGIFQSSTGQIVLNHRQGTFVVDTDRTDAVAFSALPGSLSAGDLTVSAATTGALVSISAIDDAETVEESERLLMIFATDAHNTNMRFRDRDQKIIEDFGTLPVQIKEGEIQFSLKGNMKSWRISPVYLNGEVGEEVLAGAGELSIRLRNHHLARPTTYFLIEREL